MPFVRLALANRQAYTYIQAQHAVCIVSLNLGWTGAYPQESRWRVVSMDVDPGTHVPERPDRSNDPIDTL